MQLKDVKEKIIEMCEQRQPDPFNQISNWDLVTTFGQHNMGLVSLALTQLKSERVVEFTHNSGLYQISGYRKPFGRP